MKSVYSRQFSMIASLILISFLLLGVSFATVSYHYTTEEQMTTLEENAAFIGEFTGTYRAQGLDIRSTGFQAYLFSLAKISNAHVLLCETDGTIVYSADPTGSVEGLVGRQLSSAVLENMLGDGSYSRLGTLGGLYTEKRYIAGETIRVSQLGSEMEIGYVFVSTAADSITEFWRALSSLFVLTALAVGLVAFLFTSVTSRWETKPLKQMAEAARKFGHGDFTVRVSADRHDEIGELANAFNAMAESLAQGEQRRSEFVANISHELKTPMTTIAGFADGILDGTIPPEKQEQALRTISSETRRLSRLTRRMLDLSRLQNKDVSAQEPFDIVELAARVLVSLEGKISEKKLDVQAEFPEEPVKVWGDPDAITQVCYNLLDNAIKFAREGGHLGMSITTRAGKAYVAVRDEGETIPPQELPLIFDRFHKSDKSRAMDREGVGLGLYIVKTILNEHRENITVTSEEGLTEFQFTLTLA